MTRRLTYSDVGIDIDATDKVKRRMAATIDKPDSRVLNKLGAFASVVEARFPGIDDPVLVLKVDEPGSKQKLAVEYGRTDGLAFDLINHLVNDIAVMGAHPVYVLDCIVAGSLEAELVSELVAGMSAACSAVGAVLVGGETSVQPAVLDSDTYVLSAMVVGVAERSQLIDGTRIVEGDQVLGVRSNGLHTNGYSLARRLLEEDPACAERLIEGTRFIDLLMRPHLNYYPALKPLFAGASVHGLAHITGGGMADNVRRVLLPTVDAKIDADSLRPLPIFSFVRDAADADDAEMLRTFNMGCGLAVIAPADEVRRLEAHFGEVGHECWPIGDIEPGSGDVHFVGAVDWSSAK